ncbi:unnamed protein product [Rhodiola kirilowii]
MEKGKIIVAEDDFMLNSPPAMVVAAALVGDRCGKHVIKWMLDNFESETNIIFKLLHVRPKIKLVPTPTVYTVGNLIPISQVREDVAEAYRKEMEWRATEQISLCKKIFLHKKVPIDVIMFESDDEPNVISEEVETSSISKLVIESSSTSLFSRKLTTRNLSARISECIPSTCTVYAISNGKLLSVRPSDSDKNESSRDGRSDTCFFRTNSSSMNSTIQTGFGVTSYHLSSYSMPTQTFQTLATVSESLLHHGMNSLARGQSLDSREFEDVGIFCPVNSEIGSPIDPNSSYCNSTVGNLTNSAIPDHDPDLNLYDAGSSECQEFFNLELEKLKIELRHVRGMYAVAQTETLDASSKIAGLNRRRLDKVAKLKETKEREDKAFKIAIEEKEMSDAASRKAEAVMELAEREAAQKIDAENRAIADANETKKLVTGQVQNYQTFTWEELAAATSSFSKELEIGRGANGTVYKCTLHHTAAAVKVLHSDNARGTNQFQKELEILSRIHHPHLLMLLGACPEHSCLVYKHMKNGNLEERLQCKGNTPPLPWVERFRIAWEVASALVFLHSTKPKSIIHCDLKPANILLDSNLVSKIGDVGLSTILNPDSLSTMVRDTGLVGTLCYIDPEYQRCGIVSPMSDVYALGMVILQLLTGRQAMGLAHIVEMAIMDDRLSDILDSGAGSWPVEEAKELALLGLSCVEIRRKDRPDLKNEVLPKLEKLKISAAGQAKELICTLSMKPPAHFICPILEEVMEDPHVAADGYSYDRKAIMKRLEETDKSFITGLPLPHKQLEWNLDDLERLVFMTFHLVSRSVILNLPLARLSAHLQNISSPEVDGFSLTASFPVSISSSINSTGEIKDYRILTDILGLKDHLVDIDFKVAGTPEGKVKTKDLWREAQILSNLHRPSVLAFCGVVPDGADGTLELLPEFKDAAFGMEYIYNKALPHFDLYCDNLLVNQRDLQLQRPICKKSNLENWPVLNSSSRGQSLDSREFEDVGISCPVNSEIGSLIDPNSSYCNSTVGNRINSTIPDHDPALNLYDASSSECQEFFNLELEKLKIELRHVQGMHAVAQMETLDASRKIAELNRWRLDKVAKLKETKEREDKALKIAREEKEMSEAASREAEAAMELAEREAAQKRDAEKRAMSDANEMKMLGNAVTGQVQNYQTFTWEELAAATSSFSKELEIGRGANGTVYKCTLHHTAAAVKVLHSDNARGTNQFQKELEILSRIHHPHLLMLLGACPEHSCLVYKHMKNGNLEERLQCKGNTPPLPWVERFRIAWEVASALVFLHSTKPKSIIHCDLKPANILLDSNLVSKIGDVGLSTILNPDSLSTMVRDTGLVGTLCYIDPEYQRSGIVSPMSDVYALGMVILQLLTGRQAMGLAHIVEMAIMDDRLSDILDSGAGSWPVEEAKELALLGLSCVEIRRKDRYGQDDLVT